MKHTEGPWKLEARVQPVVSHGMAVRAPDGSGLAWVLGGESEECKANARLIAASPKLLAVCKLMLSNMKSLSAASSHYQRLYEHQISVLEEVIKEATKES